MSLSSDESSVKDIDTGSSSSSSSTVGDEKSRESRPQEDDTLSSILLMLKSNTNDDDDDVAAADLEVSIIYISTPHMDTLKYIYTFSGCLYPCMS